MRHPPSDSPTAFPFLVLGTTLGVQTLVSMTALAVPAVSTEVARGTGLSVALVGVFVALLFGGAMLSAVISGPQIVRHGAIRVSQVSLLLCALGMAVTATGVAHWMVVGAVLIGLGYGSVTPASSHLLTIATPSGLRGLVFSLKQTGVPLGGVLAGALMPSAVHAFGWRGALALVSAACVASAAFVQPTRSRFDADRDRAHRPRIMAALRPVTVVLRHADMRRLAISTVFFGAMQLCLSAYLVAQLQAAAGIGLVAAGLLLALAQGAGVVGRIAWGAMADRWISSKLLLALLAVAMGGCALLAAAITPAWRPSALALLAVAFGATATGWNGVYLAEVARLAPPGQAGVLTGGTLFFTYGGVVIGPPTFAAIVAASGSISRGYAAIGATLVLLGLVLLSRQGSRQT